MTRGTTARTVSRGVVAALLVALAPAAASTSAVAAPAGPSVVELDLAGVDEATLPTLPDPAAVPLAEAEPAAPSAAAPAAGPDAPVPTPEPAGAASPEAAGDALPGTTSATDATDGPTAETTPDAATDTDATAAEPPAARTMRSAAAPAATDDEARPDVLTRELDTAPFSVLGITWESTPELEDVVVRYRVRVDGTWSTWSGVEGTDVAPDAGTRDDVDGRDGTDPLVAVGADGLQVWAEAAKGDVRGLKAVLVDPGTDAAAGADARLLAAPAAPGQPAIISRAGWGADESLRTCQPDYSPQMLTAAVHHTASTNSYSAADVPGLLRGFYAYHTRPESAGGRGWCDIGYNFLVDRFGRVFEGRAGGVASTVVGVHTGGFNSRTIGVAAIGNLDTAAPSNEMVVGIADLIAWKFSVHGILANTSVSMVSGGGASRYPAGTRVTFPTVYGHRDAALTSCPGQRLYDLLPAIRDRVAALANASVARSPQASLDVLRGTSTGVVVSGWAFDPDSAAALRIDVSVDGAVTSLTADRPRPDVAAAFGVGPDHGFSGTVPAGAGRHVVCVTAVNVGSGADVVLGCDTVRVDNATPFGSLDVVRSTGTGVLVAGWALDPDTLDPIDVHVYVDGVGSVLRASGSRPDVAAAYGRDDHHGFSTVLPTSQGDHQVCVYMINSPTGVNPLLGCRTVSVGSTPVGSLDLVRATPDGVVVGGWAFDPDTSDPIDVHVYVDGRPTVVRAAGSRPDVAAVYRRGDRAGFDARITADAGRHDVCVYMINAPSGVNPLLGCRTVEVVNATPIGSWDVTVGTAGGVRLAGWALDPDTTRPIDLHVYVDGRVSVVRADRSRPDVAAVFGLGPSHGFDAVVPASAGSRSVCAYMINTPAGTNPLLGCRVVTTR
jgi:hypothetical protein